MSNFNIGDRVQWMKTTRQGSSVSMDTRYGTITQITDGNATILPDGGKRTVVVATSVLRFANEPTRVNDLVQRVFKRNRGR